LAESFKIKGVHLPEKKRKSSRTIALLKRKKTEIISASFHGFKDLNRSRKKYEYVFLSPVFDSISKKGYKKNIPAKEIETKLRYLKQNVIALGGITDKNIIFVKDAGFIGVATIGYIWSNKTPVKKFKTLLSKIQ
jgi:thiamine-phosphate pyrophosphorylase